jgi:hypothetical protein
MRPHARHRTILVAVFVGAIALSGGSRPAHAQWGGGFGGFGWGFGGFSQVEKPESFLYQKALVDAGRNVQTPSRDVYANNSNSYINNLRDNGLVERYSAARREPSHYRYPNPEGGARAAMAAPPMPVLPLASFYDATGRIEWPANGPTEGDMATKRATFEQSSQVAIEEIKKNGVASMASITDARQKLLDYGRPALHFIRAHDTPRVADTFHLFLLSLYESLAQAVNPVATAAAPTPAAPA